MLWHVLIQSKLRLQQNFIFYFDIRHANLDDFASVWDALLFCKQIKIFIKRATNNTNDMFKLPKCIADGFLCSKHSKLIFFGKKCCLLISGGFAVKISQSAEN
jgi:hypothetical protein